MAALSIAGCSKNHERSPGIQYLGLALRALIERHQSKKIIDISSFQCADQGFTM
jgi:hypothetical protein